jgi:hypothetical protein
MVLTQLQFRCRSGHPYENVIGKVRKLFVGVWAELVTTSLLHDRYDGLKSSLALAGRLFLCVGILGCDMSA